MYFFSMEKMKPRTSLARRSFIGHSSHSSNIKSFYSGKQAVAKKTSIDFTTLCFLLLLLLLQ